MDPKTTKKQNPSEFLRQIIGKPVVVKLNSGVDYRGILACLDGYMNIALEQTEEYVNGQVRSHAQFPTLNLLLVEEQIRRYVHPWK